MRKGSKIRNLRGYLFTILHNARISHLRRQENGIPHIPVEDATSALSVEANQHHRAELQALSQELTNLREEQRQVILLVCVEGLTYREAAAAIGVPIGTVMSRLARARQALIERTDERMPPTSMLMRVK
jgi:RNA polymerase sigma-70 factor (ECF subfamily)